MQLGRTPLWVASLNGNTGVMEVLLAHGADVNTCDKVTALSSLSTASPRSYPPVLVPTHTMCQ